MNRWAYRPYFGDKSDKALNIPFFGAAKAGFIAMYRQLNSKGSYLFGLALPEVINPSTGRPSRKPYATVLKRLHGYDQFVSATNEVEYAAKISPGAAETGMRKASARMLKSYRAVLERLTEKANAL